ncbi:MAG: shikimate dehydrogenase [Alphaproteobacteria bacterium]
MKKQAGIIGWPVSHSLSPVLYKYWLKLYNIDGAYTAKEVKPEKLSGIMQFMQESNFIGFNITVPHKEKIIPLLDSIDTIAAAIGAVNTVVYKEGKWQGTNTDVAGFINYLKVCAPDIRTTRAVVLGGGGAARAVIYALKQMGFSNITLCNRTKDRATQLAEEFSVQQANWESREKILQSVDLLVNTTTLGMEQKGPLEIDLSALPQDATVYDIVYTPLNTALLQQAERRGNNTVDGLGMLLHQAVPAFEAWFGVRPEVDAALGSYMRAQL